MAARYRVETLRPGHVAPGLVGDYDSKKAASQAAVRARDDRPDDRVTITPGTDELTDHPNGHHFTATGDSEEV